MFSNLYIYLVVEKIKLGYQITLKLNMCTLFSVKSARYKLFNSKIP